MPQWKNGDLANNAPRYAPQQFSKTANVANRDALFGNTTTSSFVTGEKIGIFAASADETQASKGAITHSGWVLKREGTGNRAGRVFYETLIAGGIAGADSTDDVAIPDFGLFFNLQPANTSSNSTNNSTALFSSNAYSKPAGATFTYQWQRWSGAAFANLTNTGAYSNVTTKNMSVLANAAPNGDIVRILIGASAANIITSGNAVLTVTT